MKQQGPLRNTTKRIKKSDTPYSHQVTLCVATHKNILTATSPHFAYTLVYTTQTHAPNTFEGENAVEPLCACPNSRGLFTAEDSQNWTT